MAVETIPRDQEQVSSTLTKEEVMVIEASRGRQMVDWRKLRRYRDLFYFLVWPDIEVRYAQPILGIGWAVIQLVFSMPAFVSKFGVHLRLHHTIDWFFASKDRKQVETILARILAERWLEPANASGYYNESPEGIILSIGSRASVCQKPVMSHNWCEFHLDEVKGESVRCLQPNHRGSSRPRAEGGF